ncbi:MAG: thiol:disulfide interchange protein, partial [Verrucomicrobiales bacterium]|nr:thiol:disulfide interchange protein [Verrucomicrobiales bacterium]
MILRIISPTFNHTRIEIGSISCFYNLFVSCLSKVSMRIVLGLVLFLMSSLVSFAAHTRVDILFSASSVKPGETVWAAIRLQMDPGWHTYWRNSGEAGIPTKLTWTLPAGLKTGEISWPIPTKFSEPVLTNSLTTYAFAGEAILLVPISVASDAAPGPLHLKAGISWLECQKECVPGRTNVEVDLVVGSQTVLANEA